MKSACVVLSLLIASIIVSSTIPVSSAIPVSASRNLLQNPGFETGGFPPWDWDWYADDGDAGAWISNSNVHSGSWAAGMGAEGWEAGAWIWQSIALQCARYLEFWYVIDESYVENDAGVHATIYYSDGTYHHEELDYVEQWTLAHIDLDTTKQVKEVELSLSVDEADVLIYVDDFYLAACVSNAVGGELMPTLPFLNSLMAVAIVVSIVASTITLGYKFAKK